MISFRFLKSSLIYTISGAMPLATGFLLLGAYLQFLDKTYYGELSLYLAFTLLMQVIISLGLDSSFQFFYHQEKNDQRTLHAHISTVLVSILGFGILSLLISLVAGPFILQVFFKLEFFPWGLVALATAVGNCILKAYCNLLINQQQPVRYFLLNFLVSVVIISLTLILFHFHPNSLLPPLISRFIAAMGVLAIIMFLVYRESGFHFYYPILRNILIYSTPLFIMLMLSWTQNYANSLVINKYMRLDDVGTYDFAFKCTLLIDFMVAGLNSSITPKIYSHWADQKIKSSTIEINRYWNAITSLIIMSICFTICAAPIVIKYLDKKNNYEDAITFIPLLSLVFLFRGFQMMASTPLIFFKKSKVFPWIYLLVAASQLILSFTMIGYFGLYGAIWAVFAAKLLEILLLYNESRKIFSYSFNSIKLIWLPLLFFIAVVVTDYAVSVPYKTVAYYLLSTITFLGIFLLYRNEIRFTLTSWKNKLIQKF